MLNVPTLKFDKSINYIESQIDIQKNNKQLILDIITNLGLIIKNSTEPNENLNDLLSSANTYLQTVSNNITTLEQLHLEILNITNDLNDTMSPKTQTPKTREYYIAAFSNIKNNIIQYTEKFENIEKKLEVDNNLLNEFITKNEFKYTVNEIPNNENSSNAYELESFSVNDEATISKNFDDEISIETKAQYENVENEITNKYFSTNEYLADTNDIVKDNFEDVSISSELEAERNQKIDELTNEFKDILISLYNSGTANLDANTIFKNCFSKILNQEKSTEIINTVKEEVKEELSDNNNLEESSDITLESFDNVVESSSTLDEFLEISLGKDFDIIKEIEEQEKSTHVITSSEVEQLLLNNISTPEFKNSNDDFDKSSKGMNNPIFKAPTTKIELKNKQLKDYKINRSATTFKRVAKKPKNLKVAKDYTISNINDLVEIIKKAEIDNNVLIISEHTNSIYLPYTIPELVNYVDNYPDTYKSLADVVEQEFIIDWDTFSKNPSKTRFIETYNLLRNREGKSAIRSFIYALRMSRMSNINPAVIAACKKEYELDSYLTCLSRHRLKSFKCFKIIYDVNPLKKD